MTLAPLQGYNALGGCLMPARKDCRIATVAEYRAIITRILTEETQHIPKQGDITICPVFDPVHDQYQVLYMGWDGEAIRPRTSGSEPQ